VTSFIKVLGIIKCLDLFHIVSKKYEGCIVLTSF